MPTPARRRPAVSARPRRRPTGRPRPTTPAPSELDRLLDEALSRPAPEPATFAELGVPDFAYYPSADAGTGYAVTLGQPSVSVLDTGTWQPTQQLDLAAHTQGSPQRLAVAGDGGTLFVLTRDAQLNYDLVIFAIDIAGGRRSPVRGEPRAHELQPRRGRHRHAGRKADGPGAVVPMQLNGLAVSPDGTRVFATDQIMSGVRVFDSVSLRLIQTISWNSDVQGPWGVAITPDASQLFTANLFSGDLGIVQQVQAAPGSLLDGELDIERFGAFGADPGYQGLLIRRSLKDRHGPTARTAGCRHRAAE